MPNHDIFIFWTTDICISNCYAALYSLGVILQTVYYHSEDLEIKITTDNIRP